MNRFEPSQNLRLVYAPGSLYTSILPCLALHSVGPLIATSPSLKYKILLLNSTRDRETPDYSCLDFVKAISSACNRAYGEDLEGKGRRTWEPREFVSHVVYLEGTKVEVDREELEVSERAFRFPVRVTVADPLRFELYRLSGSRRSLLDRL